MNDVYLSVIIPAYNEESRIAKTLDIIHGYLVRQDYTWEILVVLDGPKDNTLGVIKDFSEGKANIRWIDRKENKGKGYTVREGMLAAKGQVRLFTDADNSTDISHIEKMKVLFDQGYDVVIASRDPKDAPGATQAKAQTGLKRLLGNMGNLFIQIMAVRGVWDTQCGFKAFRDEAAKKIFSVALIDRWGFDIEALALTRKFGYKLGFIPAYWINDEASHVTLMTYFDVLWETVKIRINLILRRYSRHA